jgi:hypothetical protein
MGATSRTKGNAGEREIAALIRDLTGCDVCRRVRQHDGDSDLMGVPGWSIEVKRHARALRGDIALWWRQAVEQARADERPVLFFRQNRDDWRAVWSLGAHLGGEWSLYAMTVEGGAQAWAAAARDGAEQRAATAVIENTNAGVPAKEIA